MELPLRLSLQHLCLDSTLQWSGGKATSEATTNYFSGQKGMKFQDIHSYFRLETDAGSRASRFFFFF